jgi:hypothetical protein
MISKLLSQVRDPKVDCMRAIATKVAYQECPKSILALGFSAESETHISVNKEYTVWAVARWKGVLFFQIVNDVEYPSWLPSWLFTLSDKSVPSGWVCSIFDDEIEMILGPKFIAESQATYEAMVELTPNSVEQFWRNVKESENDDRVPE